MVVNKTDRLSNSQNYKRPQKTIQDTLTPAQIKEKLGGYLKVDSISTVPLNSHVRYFSLATDPKTKELKQMFRLGGFLTNKDNCDEYVILSNGTKSWSVQVGTSIFYRKLTQAEQDAKHHHELQKRQSEIQGYKDKINKLESDVHEKNTIIEKLVLKLKSYKSNANNVH